MENIEARRRRSIEITRPTVAYGVAVRVVGIVVCLAFLCRVDGGDVTVLAAAAMVIVARISLRGLIRATAVERSQSDSDDCAIAEIGIVSPEGDVTTPTGPREGRRTNSHIKSRLIAVLFTLAWLPGRSAAAPAPGPGQQATEKLSTVKKELQRCLDEWMKDWLPSKEPGENRVGGYYVGKNTQVRMVSPNVAKISITQPSLVPGGSTSWRPFLALGSASSGSPHYVCPR
jgi:hypothetical protein